MPRIKSINIHAFRGIPELDLSLDGKNLILKGENATGKSSIVESFEYFFTGNLSIFAGEGTQSLSLQRHAPHKNFKKEDVSIKVAFDPGNIVLERTFETAPMPTAPLIQYFEAAQKGTFVLRRSQILKFIASPPADRSRAIATIIGVERLDNIELAMKRAYEELNNGVSSKNKRLEDILSQMSGYFGSDITDTTQALNLMNKKFKEVSLTQVASFDELNKVSDEFLKSLKESTDFEHITKLSEAIQELGEFDVDPKIPDDFAFFNEKLRPLLEERARKELLLREFLARGQQAVKTDERNVCPLCGQNIDREKLLEQINERLQTLSELSEEATKIRQLASNIEAKLSSLQDDIDKVCSEIEPIEQLSRIREKITKSTKQLTKLQDKLKLAKELKLNQDLSVDEFRGIQEAVETLIRSALTKCKTTFKRIGVSPDWKKKMDMITLANRVGALAKEFMQTSKELITEEKQREIAKKVYETFSDTKKAKISQIYDAIKSNVNIFYSTLHPNEPHKNIEISVSSVRRASTDLKMESFGSVEDPRAFSSEGHLDSLGLCIFLAFVKKFNENCNFIVLDDVVTTIDSQHRRLICELLYEQFKDYQLFITTHDGIWYEQLCDHQRAYDYGGDCKNMEIVKWTLETGPVIEPYKPRWERINSKIDDGNKVGAAVEGRLYLEWLLKAICKNIMARPFFNEGKYTVSDLFNPAKARIDELVKDLSFRQKVQECL